MPTVFLVDKSLSMARELPKLKGKSPLDRTGLTRWDFAKKSIGWMLDYLDATLPYEYISLITFSSTPHVDIDFENLNHREFKNFLEQVALGDRTHIEDAISRAVKHTVSHFGKNTACQIVLVTEGRPTSSGKPTALREGNCRLHVVLLATERELAESAGATGLIGRCGGTLVPLDLGRHDEPLRAEVESFMATNFAAYRGFLKFGNLSSPIRLYPPPTVSRTQQLPTSLNIVGFIRKEDLDHPPTASRHIVVAPHTNADFLPIAEPDFRYLLFLAMREEHLVGLLELAPDWHGFIYPYAEGKLNQMMIALLRPGEKVSWCPDFHSLLYPKPVKKKSVWVRAGADDDTASEKSGSGGGGGSNASGNGSAASKGANATIDDRATGGGMVDVARPSLASSSGGGLLGALLSASNGGSVARASAAASSHVVNPQALSYSASRAPTTPLPSSSEQLRKDVTRVLALAKGLPEKRATFIKELTRLRASLISFHMPDTLAAVIKTLGTLRDGNGGSAAVAPTPAATAGGAVPTVPPTRDLILADVLQQLADGGPAACDRKAGVELKDRYAPPPSAKKAVAKSKPVAEMVTMDAGAAGKGSKKSGSKSKSRAASKAGKEVKREAKAETQRDKRPRAPDGEPFDRKPKLVKTGNTTRAELNESRVKTEDVERTPYSL